MELLKWNAVALAAMALVACGGNKTETHTGESGTTADTDTDTDADTDADTDTDTDADTDTDTDTDADTDTGPTDTAAMKYDLTLQGSGYEPHDGATIYANVFPFVAGPPPHPGASTLTPMTQVMDASGMLNIHWHNVLDDGSAYLVAWYADVDGDGACTFGTDHVWIAPVNPSGPTPQPVTGDQTVTYDHDTNFTNVCALF